MNENIKRAIEVVNKYEKMQGVETGRDIRFGLLEAGFPSELVYRLDGTLKKLRKVAIKVGDKVLKIGKVIIKVAFSFMKAAFSFIKKHPGLTIGIALGIAFSSFINFFVGWIPIIGDLLQSIIKLLSAVIGGLIFKNFDEPLRDLISLMEEFAKDLFDALRELRNDAKVEVVHA